MFTKKLIILIVVVGFASCTNESDNYQMKYLTDHVPDDIPIEFKTYNIPNDRIIHKGTFNPDLTEYYYTVSDKKFEQFDVYVQRKENGSWTEPEPAFFNSDYSDHGMSFSPDGSALYLSSTRPTNIEGISETWHIWKSIKMDGKWHDPVFINIPNLGNKLVSHPSVSNSGTMYFHASNLDYSKMDIYYSKWIDGKYEPAVKVNLNIDEPIGKCTPFVSPDEDYLIYASIGEELELSICFKDDSGYWTKPKKLSEEINNHGQGNPYVTPDNKYLFFTAVDSTNGVWKVKWVNIANQIKAD